MDNHIVNGRTCTDPDCWCNIFPAGLKSKSDPVWKPEDIEDYKSKFVDNPEHYKLEGLNVEALDVIRSVLNDEEYVGYLRGNILKYQLRAGKKDHKDQDLAKANFYSKELDKCL